MTRRAPAPIAGPTCRHCGSPVTGWGTGPPPAACGRLLCHALEHWTDNEWRDRARMADARRAAGVPAAFPELDDRARRIARR